MDQTVLDIARLRLEALEKEADELRTFIRTYVRISSYGVEETGKDGLERNSSYKERNYQNFGKINSNMLRGTDVTADTQKFSSKDEIVSAARDVLRSVYPRPLHISDLYQALIDRGIRISGKNPKGNLSAKLAPPEDLEYVRDEGWYYRSNKIVGDPASTKAKTRSAGSTPGLLNSQSRHRRQ